MPNFPLYQEFWYKNCLKLRVYYVYYYNLWYFNAHFNLTLMYFHLPSLSSVLFYLNSSWCIQLYWLGIICYKWFLWLDLSIFEKRGTKKINLELELNFHLSYTDKPRFTWFLCRSTVVGGESLQTEYDVSCSTIDCGMKNKFIGYV